MRATLEAITYEVRDVIDTMQESLPALAVDGGAAANDLLCQFQADLLGVPVLRPRIVETTALGAAFMAGLGTGVWASTEELRDTWQLDRRFDPQADSAIDEGYRQWQRAVERSKGWADAWADSGRPSRTASTMTRSSRCWPRTSSSPAQ